MAAISELCQSPPVQMSQPASAFAAKWNGRRIDAGEPVALDLLSGFAG
jgi:hypothetical protein